MARSFGTSPAIEVVKLKWGGGDLDKVPSWVVALAEACDTQSRPKMAMRLGYAPSVISQLLNKTYNGSMERAEAMVRGALLSETLICPADGEIPRDLCLDHQKRSTPPFTSSWRSRIYRACRGGCPNYRGSK